jgi:nitroimidazol reductase NimA-like FMN-containing flavoprotein (pyridoxamine 5'-phosphate oxidase superfamily)
LEPNQNEANTDQVRNELYGLFSGQRLGVLSTSTADQPYASLVAFAASIDLKNIYFATSRVTRKYNNLSINPNAAMLIDNRSNQAADFRQAMAATASGEVMEIGPQDNKEFLECYLQKHPNLAEFVDAPATAAFCLRVKTYYLVSRFQNVIELHINP